MRVMTLAGLKEKVERAWKQVQEWFILMWINIYIDQFFQIQYNVFAGSHAFT